MVRMAMSRPIDVLHLGRERVICAFEIDGLIVDPGPSSAVENMLRELSEPPRALLLTHIHLDHAGATGTLVRRWPSLQVYVHERGAPHLVDPSKLLRSAGQLYGDDMDRLWGEVLPVPEENLHVLVGGETVHGFRVAYTPGHASHHVCYFHEACGDAYVGDVAGVRIPPSDFVRPPTPPPDIDVEQWERSIDMVAAREPQTLALTHFGAVAEPLPHLEKMKGQLSRQADLVRRILDEHGDTPQAVQAFIEESARLAAAADGGTSGALETAVPIEQTWMGLRRYWAKRAERAGQPG